MTEILKIEKIEHNRNTVCFTDKQVVDLSWCPGAQVGQLWEVKTDDDTNRIVYARRVA